jgi:hypothetical protein
MASPPTVPIGPRDIGALAHLLFEWPIRQAPRLALPLCILLAAVVQAGMMVVFSISYRTPVQNTPAAPPTRLPRGSLPHGWKPMIPPSFRRSMRPERRCPRRRPSTTGRATKSRRRRCALSPP